VSEAQFLQYSDRLLGEANAGDVHVLERVCRFRFQRGTGEFFRGFFGFNWDWNPASVPIETENSARSGENGLSLKCGFPALHILVGDLLLPRSNRFHGELVKHAEDFCGDAIRGPRERSQALNR